MNELSRDNKAELRSILVVVVADATHSLVKLCSELPCVFGGSLALVLVHVSCGNCTP
jgi:hypothetical protein